MRWFRRSDPPEEPEPGRDAGHAADADPALGGPAGPTEDPILARPATAPGAPEQTSGPPPASAVAPLAADLRAGASAGSGDESTTSGRTDEVGRTGVADAVAPVTVGRLEQALRDQSYQYRLGADGSLGGNWDGNLFSIALAGPNSDVLQVRGTWHRTIDAELAPGIAQVVNDWNRDRIWPKVYTRPIATGLRAHTEVSVDVSAGASQAQVAEILACGLGAGVQFFAALGDLLPAE